MTALTPQQMRQMAVTHFPTAGPREREIIAVLRTAADQLEAVQAVLDEPWEEEHDDAYYLDLHTDAENRMRRILAADTMSQRGRDE